MDCPQCKGYQLEPKEIEPGLIGGVCTKCEGALLALMNYRFWADGAQIFHEEAVGERELVTTDNAKAMACPKCSRFMTKFSVSGDADNRIDLCTGCDEAWLDKGEWRLLKQLDLHDQLPKIFTDAWQRNIRLKRQEQSLERRYEALLGPEDFAKVVEFKQWLVQQENASDIRHFLNVKFD